MKCPFCGETENLHIDLDYDKPDLPIDDVLCNECGKYLSDFINKQHDLDPEYSQIINEHFWELVDTDTNNKLSNANVKPESKAMQLVWDMYIAHDSMSIAEAKVCALVAVREILNAYPHTYDAEIEYTRDNDEITVITNVRSNNEYWYKVKEEIEKL